MKFFHLSDLHLGRRLSETSLLEDQKYILKEILHFVDEEKPDAVLIAGDIYDRSVPSDEATSLCDWMISEFHKRCKVFISSGNHDSQEKVAYGGTLFKESGVYVSEKYDGRVDAIDLTDEYGRIHVYMLPYIKPFEVRRAFPDEPTDTYSDAVKTAIHHMKINKEERNIILAHQFITGALTSDSETVSVGGLDNVDASVFHDFDYVALGHIHKPQWIIKDKVRYCGTPLKYSFSEVGNENSITVVEMKEKGNITFSFIPLHPLHDMKVYDGFFDEILKSSDSSNYTSIILHDKDVITDAASRLREKYPLLLEMKYDNMSSKIRERLNAKENVKDMDPLSLFGMLFKDANGDEMTDEEKKYITEVLKNVWGEEK